jgi:hypothetical protein
MADNINITPSGSSPIAADDIASVWHQRVKVEYGADGSATDVAATTPLPVVDKGNNTTFHRVSTADANAVNVKASPGVVRGITIFNNTTYPVFLKFHNTAGTPTAGSGVVRAFGCQAGVLAVYTPPGGINFSTGIGITIVKDITDAGTTAVAAGDCVLDLERE